MNPEDIVAIDFDGALIEGEDVPPMEFPIHAELYRRRPDVAAAVHAHPAHSTLFTMTGRAIEPVFPHGAVLVGADIREAFALAIYLEDNAKSQYMAEALGTP